MADEREPAWAGLPSDDMHSEVLDGPAPVDPTGEWLGWATAS
jgi:hypothetical protein